MGPASIKCRRDAHLPAPVAYTLHLMHTTCHACNTWATLLPTCYQGKTIDSMRRLDTLHYGLYYFISRVLPRHEEIGGGDRRHRPHTPTHDNVSDYVATYTKANVCVLIRRGKRIGCQDPPQRPRGDTHPEDLTLPALPDASHYVL